MLSSAACCRVKQQQRHVSSMVAVDGLLIGQVVPAQVVHFMLLMECKQKSTISQSFFSSCQRAQPASV